MASIPQAQEGVGVLGHVEYTVLDSDLAIKKYLQTDNVVVLKGLDCAGEYLFGTSDSTTCTSDSGSTTALFQFIAIGNGSQTAAALGTDTELEDDASGGCGNGVDGEQAVGVRIE